MPCSGHPRSRFVGTPSLIYESTVIQIAFWSISKDSNLFCHKFWSINDTTFHLLLNFQRPIDCWLHESRLLVFFCALSHRTHVKRGITLSAYICWATAIQELQFRLNLKFITELGSFCQLLCYPVVDIIMTEEIKLFLRKTQKEILQAYSEVILVRRDLLTFRFIEWILHCLF